MESPDGRWATSHVVYGVCMGKKPEQRPQPLGAEESTPVPPWLAAVRRPLQLFQALGRDLSSGLLSLQAMGLVYTTLLSLVPLLAVSFSVLQGFGYHNQLEPMLLNALKPLGAGSQEVAQQLITYVDKTNVRVLGSVGLVVLLYSVLSLISKIEQVFNMTWRIDEQRPLGERFSRYLSVLLVGPVLLVAAVTASASVRSNSVVQDLVGIEPLGFLVHIAEQFLPFALITAAFTFVYSFVPNTRVRWLPALIGGAVAGLLWLTVGDLFARFVAGSTRYAAIYSGLAIVILFMIWVYIAWLIVLVGANIAFYIQYPEYLAVRERELRLSNRLRERVGLQLMQRIAQRHFDGDDGLTAEELAHDLGMPLGNVRRVIELLCKGQFLVETAGKPARFLPARAPETVSISELLDFIRRAGEEVTRTGQLPENTAIGAIEQRVQRAAEETLGSMSLRDLVMPGAVNIDRSPTTPR
jgi:membrane protein